MTRKTTNILLLISLAFNLAVISMFTVNLFRMREFGARKPFSAKLPHEQVRKHFKEMKPIHQDYIKSKRSFFKVLRSEKLDLEKAEEMLETTIQKQILMEKQLGKRLIELRKELSAEEFRKLASRKRFGQGQSKPIDRPKRNKINPKGGLER